MFVPLLSLSVDQMVKMKSAQQEYGAVGVDHLDELPMHEGALMQMVKSVDGINRGSTLTYFIITSPQAFVRNSSKPLVDALLRAHERNVLSTVAIDEAHLFVQHYSFCVAICLLRKIFFEKVFPKDYPKSHPIFLAMSATMTSQFITILENITYLRFPSERRLWPNHFHFRQRNVMIKC